jgi:hypothetical protein
MQDKKDIGQAFREKLDSLNRQPGDALWNSISRDLDKKKKRKFPFFWFSILSFSVLAIVGLVYFASNFNGNNNSGLTKQESLQNDIPANHSTTGIQNPVENKNTPKASSVSGVADNQNDKDKRTDATDAKVKSKNSASANSASTAKVKSDDKKGSNTGKAIFEAGAGSKTGRNKNNATANKGRKQTISNQDETASTDNLKIAKTTNKSKKRSTPLYNPKNKAVVASGNGNTESGFAATASSSKRSRKKTATQSNAQEQKSITEFGKRPANAPGETSATAFVRTGAEAANREGVTATVHDTLSENSLIPKDSLITELPKEEVAEEKEKNKKDSLNPVVVKRFSVFAYGGPSFFNFPEKTIVTDSTTSNITTKSATRFGVLLGYRLNSKLSIRTGLSVYKLKQSASKIKLNYIMGGGDDAANPGLIPSDDFTWIDYKLPFGMNSSQIINTLGENYQVIINIDRDLSYLEIPLEIGYNLFDRKFGVDVFGGGSMLLLTKNEVSAYNEKGRMYLGKWNAAATTSFTGTLGLNLNYNLNPSLQLNAEPVLNYYFNTYNDSKPSSFSVRVGLQYNFDIGAKKK